MNALRAANLALNSRLELGGFRSGSPCFALAALALVASGHDTAAIVFAVTAAINAELLARREQWER